MASPPTSGTSFSSEEGRQQRGFSKKCDHDRDRQASTLPSPSSGPSSQPSSQGNPLVHTDIDSKDDDASLDEESSIGKEDCLDEEAIDAAYNAVWDDFHGLPPPDDILIFHLGCQSAYKKLHDKLAQTPGLQEHYEQSVRRDWDADTGDLVLRTNMTTDIHAVFVGQLTQAITKKLDYIKNKHPRFAPYCQKLVSGWDARVSNKKNESDVPTFEKDLDGQLKYDEDEAKYPPLIFEVAYSQQDYNARSKACQVLKNFLGRVCTALVFEIKYANAKVRQQETHSHQASVFILTSEVRDGQPIIELAQEAIFRNDGQCLSGEIVLPLTALLPFYARDTLPESAPDLRLSFQELTECLETAERFQRRSDKPVQPLFPTREIVFVKNGKRVGEEDLLGPEPKKRMT
ncbi:hypothetical protein F5Y07DRAFT_404389 [Xylaria sp. FL0933]|nr:hypothetical protein F5Y07DRAFT_404389 [Xylaria sp. FL0933]